MSFFLDVLAIPFIMFLCGAVFAANLEAIVPADPFFQPRVWKLILALVAAGAAIMVEVGR